MLKIIIIIILTDPKNASYIKACLSSSSEEPNLAARTRDSLRRAELKGQDDDDDDYY